MKTLGTILAAIAAVAFTGGVAAAETYKWVDRNGVVNFGDAPPAGVKPSVRTEPSEAPEAAPTVAEPSPAPSDSAAPAPEAAPAAAPAPKLKENPQVEIYGTAWCPYCAKAREFFRSRGIAFADYDIEKDLDALNRKRRIDDSKGVPTVVIDGEVIHGFSEAAFIKALTAAP